MKIKVQKFSKTVNPFSGISFANNIFNQVGMSHLIDNELGDRVELFGYQYSDIIRNLVTTQVSFATLTAPAAAHS